MWYFDMILGTRPLNNTFLSTVPPLLSGRECYAFFPGSCFVLRVEFSFCFVFLPDVFSGAPAKQHVLAFST